MSRILKLFTVAALFGAIFVVAGTANATHSWGGYHWARTANPFTIKFGDNVSTAWDSYLATAASDWSITSGSCNNPSNPVRATVVPGGTNPKPCRPTAGRVEVCNSTYGGTGWLGIAQIWVSGDHITQGVAKMNDTYFNTATYNTPCWRSFVMDQELGHTLGLAHQDENFYNADLLDACGRGSCMDYSAEPCNNTKPNQHDYDELVTIYNHLDATTTLSAPIPSNVDADLDSPGAWGQSIRSANGRGIVYERDLGAGNKMITYVIWAE